MGWHCDTSYNNNGLFKHNSQVENTPVVIVTYGHDRTINWQRVVHSGKGWVRDKTWCRQSMKMNSDSYMLLHPVDEKPFYNHDLCLKSRYQHGNIRMKKNNQMSIAIVFRVVSTYNNYNINTNKMINKTLIDPKELEKQILKDIKRIEVYDQFEKINEFEKNIQQQYKSIRHL